MAWSPRGTKLATCSDDFHLRIVDARRGVVEHCVAHGDVPGAWLELPPHRAAWALLRGEGPSLNQDSAIIRGCDRNETTWFRRWKIFVKNV